MDEVVKNYPFKYEFYTDKASFDATHQLFKVEFKIASKFIKLPFYKKGIALRGLFPFKNSLPYELTNEAGQSYRINKDVYAASDVGDYIVLEYKSERDYQLPLRTTLFKSHELQN